ncbi:MAG: monovalent cation/H+ antiporter subunit D family protein [Verrucomicrobiota bacterium]|nr:monovalent cation/H+ antiporter subunit D family protein [Verrucomicrobiota bacterium]MEE2968032.1 monovalent cation/H+ antiporter subunit D family protein [Verrucomicrobiota bacterium]|tara:strand:+ start:1320 stop:2786 length:1467 start_codon:yes stop_codon:yes gene_type:complete
MTEFSFIPLFTWIVSLLAVPAILLFRRRADAREGVTFVAAFLKLCMICMMLPLVKEGKILRFTFGEILPGIPIEFRVDGLGMLFALVASSLWILTTLYSIGYMRGLKEHDQTRFFCCFAISLSATIGVAFAGNLLTLYIFYEILSLSTYPLVTHHGDKEARSGGRTYLSHLLGTSVAFALPAMIYCYWKKEGDINFTDGSLLTTNIDSGAGLIVLLALTFGFAKNGLMPFHSWLPNAMVAPTPVSALLHAVAVVKVGVFCVIRVFTGVFGIELLKKLDVAVVVSWIAAFTVITSSLIALSQDNLKRRLAFSTIGQLSYIILGVSLLSDFGVTGSILHVAMHAFGKITLFFCAGAIYVAMHKKYVSELVGIGRKMPITMTAFAIGSLSVIGLPVTGGLVSKWYLVMGTAQSGQIALLVVFLISSILNACYFLPIVYRAFFCRPEESLYEGGRQEAPLACLIPLCITALLSVLSFFNPGLFIELAGLIIK